MLGQSSGGYVSEMQHEFQKKHAAVNPRELAQQKELEGKIRSHHFNLGISQPSYLTTSGAAFTGKPPLGLSKSSPKIGPQDLRTAHFDLGKESSAFLTTSQADYTKKVGRPPHPYPLTHSLTPVDRRPRPDR